MRITIDLKIFLFAIIFIITKQIEFYAILMAYAIIHELGHLLCGVFLRLKPETFSITPFGLQISFKPEISLYNSKVKNGTRICVKKMLLAFAGPLTNILISIVLLFIQMDQNLKQIMIYSNILVAVFNLIPIYPLDGGRILKGVIRKKFEDNIKADTIVNKISNILVIILTAVSSILILYLKNISVLFVIIYLWILVIKENKRFNLKRKINNIISKENKCIDI